MSLRAVYADGDTVIALWDPRGTTIENTNDENSYAWFTQMRDGKVIDGTALCDSIFLQGALDKGHPRPLL